MRNSIHKSLITKFVGNLMVTHFQRVTAYAISALTIITSAKEVMFLLRYVCVLARYRIIKGQKFYSEVGFGMSYRL